MADWVRVCAADEQPKDGEVTEVNIGQRQLYLATLGGELHILDNLCPHRQGPLGQGWIEGSAVVCPWHAWAFDVCTGICEEPEDARVRVYAVREQDGAVFADLS